MGAPSSKTVMLRMEELVTEGRRTRSVFPPMLTCPGRKGGQGDVRRGGGSEMWFR